MPSHFHIHLPCFIRRIKRTDASVVGFTAHHLCHRFTTAYEKHYTHTTIYYSLFGFQFLQPCSNSTTNWAPKGGTRERLIAKKNVDHYYYNYFSTTSFASFRVHLALYRTLSNHFFLYFIFLSFSLFLLVLDFRFWHTKISNRHR